MNSTADLLAADRYKRLKPAGAIGNKDIEQPEHVNQPGAGIILAELSAPNQTAGLGESVRIFEPVKSQAIITEVS